MKQSLRETIWKGLFFGAALASVLAVALICVFLFAGGLPAIFKVGPLEFLLGQKWAPGNIPPSFGILPMIVGSVFVTLGAALTGVPIGILTAAFMARFCPRRIYSPLKAAVELLAGIPSVVYGFFGLVVLVPLVRECGWFPENDGMNILTASLLLGMMILPTVIGVSEAAIRAVPEAYYEGSLALGATHEQSVFRVLLPAARSGITAAVVLGVGRAIGETMAVVMVAGNQPRLPKTIFKGARTMTANIVMEMGYAADLHREALIATGVVLFLFILLINLCSSRLKRREANDR